MATDTQIESKKLLVSILNSSLKAAGFQRHGRTWSLESETVTIVLGLRHIQFGHSYSLDVGVGLNQLAKPATNDAYLCHLHLQLENLFPESRAMILKSLTLDKASPSEIEEFGEFVRSDLIPYLLAQRDSRVLRKDVLGGRLSVAGRLAGVREYFGFD